MASARSGWLGGAMVLDKLSIPTHPISLDKSTCRTPAAPTVSAGWVGTFFLSSIISLFCLPLNGRGPNKGWNIVSKGCSIQNNQPANQQLMHATWFHKQNGT